MNVAASKRTEVVLALEELARRKAAYPLKYVVEHDKQKEATKSDKRIRALLWGNRVGKTEWGAHETARFAQLEHPFKVLLAPFEIWCCCPSFDVQEDTTQKKLMAMLSPAEIEDKNYLRKEIIRTITMKNGVKIKFMSYEQGREKFQGTGKRLIWFDEEPPKDIWDEALARVEAGQQLDVILTMTPIKGMTWVYDNLYCNTSDPDLFVSQASWSDNPFLTEEQITGLTRRYSVEALKVRRDGKFMRRVGLVCAWFQRDVHIRHYDGLDRSWTWYEALDGGWSDPTAWLLIGVDNDNNVHIVDGFREKHMTNEQIKDLRNIKTSGLTITNGWIDCEDARLKNELANLGVHLTPVKKIAGDSKSWDETLAEKLAEYGKIQPGTGKPRLFISDNLVLFNEDDNKQENWMMQELENLVWLETKGKQGEEIKPRWDDHRRFGHHFDAVRCLAYFLVSYLAPVDDDYEAVEDDFLDDDGFYR